MQRPSTLDGIPANNSSPISQDPLINWWSYGKIKKLSIKDSFSIPKYVIWKGKKYFEPDFDHFLRLATDWSKDSKLLHPEFTNKQAREHALDSYFSLMVYIAHEQS